MVAPDLSYVLAWVGEESREVGCCGDKGIDGEGLLVVWDATDGGFFIKVLGNHSIFHRRQLASGGAESATGTGEVEINGKDIGDRRGG